MAIELDGRAVKNEVRKVKKKFAFAADTTPHVGKQR